MGVDISRIYLCYCFPQPAIKSFLVLIADQVFANTEGYLAKALTFPILLVLKPNPCFCQYHLTEVAHQASSFQHAFSLSEATRGTRHIFLLKLCYVSCSRTQKPGFMCSLLIACWKIYRQSPRQLVIRPLGCSQLSCRRSCEEQVIPTMTSGIFICWELSMYQMSNSHNAPMGWKNIFSVFEERLQEKL